MKTTKRAGQRPAEQHHAPAPMPPRLFRRLDDMSTEYLVSAVGEGCRWLRSTRT